MSSCVLSGKELSFISLDLILAHALSTGIAVKRDTKRVSSSEMVLDMSFLKCVELVTEKPFWFCRGERI